MRPEATDPSRIDRRKLLLGGTAAAGLVWAAPAILQTTGSTAMASPGGCTKCNTTIGTAPETILNGAAPASTANWGPPLTPDSPDAPVGTAIALVASTLFIANTAGGSPVASGLQQVLDLTGPCAARIAAGGVTATLRADLNGQSAGAATPVGVGSYLRVQFFNGLTAVGAPLVIQNNGAALGANVNGTVPTPVTRAVITAYLVKKGSNRATINNISLKFVCP